MHDMGDFSCHLTAQLITNVVVNPKQELANILPYSVSMCSSTLTYGVISKTGLHFNNKCGM